MTTKTRGSYQIPGASAELNFVLQSIAARLDKIEGIRGDATIESPLSVTGGKVYVYDADENLIHSQE